MLSMYELIMDLPLFKGISSDHVSQFLEKTQISFTRCKKGDIIYREGDPCIDVCYLISGSLKLNHRFAGGDCLISEFVAEGSVLSVDRLFGMNTYYADTAEALSNVSIMRFPKDQYLRLLSTDPIYLMNALNYLSLRAQRPVDNLSKIRSGSLLSFLSYWIGILTLSRSNVIEIQATRKTLCRLTNISPTSLKNQISRLRQEGLISVVKNNIKIVSRSELIDAAFRENSNEED